jgi:hypothetical protein
MTSNLYHTIASTVIGKISKSGRVDRLKLARLLPMRGLKQDASARVIIAGQAFVQNLRRGHYELAAEEPADRRAAIAFAELAVAI